MPWPGPNIREPSRSSRWTTSTESGERSDQGGGDAVIFTILHILNPSRRHIDALLVDIDEDPSAGAAPPARLAAQRSAHGSGPDWPPEDWD